jgi:two-component system copper resistance phosphate regulon response regulator CusR
MSNILVIEDDTVTATMLGAGLKKSGYQVTVAGLPSIATQTLKTEAFDVILLDIGLPEVSGFEFATTLRNFGYKGHILMLSSLSKTEDIVRGLDAGADDYITKPFVFDELLARVRSMLRRKFSENLVLKNGELIMDLVNRSVTREGKKIDLTTREFNLLEFLMRQREKVVDRNSIARHVWGSEFDPDSNVIDVYINHLRKKVDSPFSMKLLKTVVGQGYVLGKAE